MLIPRIGLRGICPETQKLVPIDGLDIYTGLSVRESPAYPRVLKSKFQFHIYLL